MRRKSGITLILSVLIVSVVVAIGITVSTVVIFQVRLNRVTAQSHQGFYAAESGLEQGLNLSSVLKGGKLSDALSTITAAALPADSSLDATYFGTSGSPKHFLTTSQSVGSTSTVPADLQEGQSTYVDIYNVDISNQALNPNVPTLCVYADGKDVDGSGGLDSAGNEILEVSWVAWDTSFKSSAPQHVFVPYSKFHSQTDCNINGSKPGASIPLSPATFDPVFTPNPSLAGYRVRITAMRPQGDATQVGWGDVQNLAVVTNPAPNAQLLLKSVSDTNSQKQALKATFPWVLPLSSLFDFTIFSEKTLVKTLPIVVDQNITSYGPYALSSQGPNTLPPDTSTPFSDCAGGTPCKYYVRLYKPSLGWSSSAFSLTFSGASVPSPASVSIFIASSAATSCIIPTAFTFSGSATSYTYTFGTVAYPSKIQLLTQPTFQGPQETYCPTS